MGWFSKKKEINSDENVPELPELPDTNSVAFDYNREPNIKTPDISLPPQYDNEYADNKPITREIETSDNPDFINEPKPGMQKSKFQPLSPQEEYIKKQENIKKPSYPIPPPQQYNPGYNMQANAPKIGKTSGIFRSPVKNIDKRNEPVYIRLDKFQMTMDAFREVKEKIKEIEDLLLRTKEIKEREDKEIEDWAREIESIKIKIQSIDKDIFNQSE